MFTGAGTVRGNVLFGTLDTLQIVWVNICINSQPIGKTKDLECKYEKGRGQGTDLPKEEVPWCQRHRLCAEH